MLDVRALAPFLRHSFKNKVRVNDFTLIHLNQLNHKIRF